LESLLADFSNLFPNYNFIANISTLPLFNTLQPHEVSHYHQNL